MNSIYSVQSSPSLLGPAQAANAPSFGLCSYMSYQLSTTGGDYGVCIPWLSWSNGGGGGGGNCGPNGCPILE